MNVWCGNECSRVAAILFMNSGHLLLFFLPRVNCYICRRNRVHPVKKTVNSRICDVGLSATKHHRRHCNLCVFVTCDLSQRPGCTVKANHGLLPDEEHCCKSNKSCEVFVSLHLPSRYFSFVRSFVCLSYKIFNAILFTHERGIGGPSTWISLKNWSYRFHRKSFQCQQLTHKKS